ncbi:molybdotransferase-like divisome protein Glp [Streptacidiphilus fuscans]|uniref:Molybdopterin molybdenumtransferase n=1 Tax=Streptacidiphilus fuscans TaxID=2789292 RepID=A0A931FIG8_9ACTN|nr:gephyrin-like molybdotransferase Glp [Streptacidiphilus fuscans]MBF9071607.1 molybdopterin molybdotransferase MoeA [Streptacidiphilus fuscans]MBF9072906.1 molybdopterin molybdotransferase MoeA [Streptacidiphilus fuscans]
MTDHEHHGHDHGHAHDHAHGHGHGRAGDAGIPEDPCAAEAAPGAEKSGDGRLWTVDEHLADILTAVAQVAPLPPLELQLLEAQGCLTVDELVSGVALPPFDNSSMDGYAVRVADLDGATKDYPSVLTVVGDVAAGAAALPVIGPGQCARIMTGAPMPPGAEAVVPVEWTDAGTGSAEAATTMAPQGGEPVTSGGEVRIFQPVESGAFVRRRGDDIAEGQSLLPAGTRLGPTQIGLLAAIGRDRVLVRPRPRVVVLSTGSELVQPGSPVGPGQITDSNSFALTAAARDAGAIAYRVGGVPDDAERLREVIDDQLIRADLIVTSGGVSVGAYDVVKEALGERVSFRKLRMQPGKPQGFGVLEGSDGPVPILALPGNPVSAYLSFELFVRPAIRAMLGATDIHRPVVTARLTEGLGSPAGRRQFARGSYDPAAGTVTPVGGAGSHLLGALAHANALIVVPEDATSVAAGAEVETVLLD